MKILYSLREGRESQKISENRIPDKSERPENKTFLFWFLMQADFSDSLIFLNLLFRQISRNIYELKEITYHWNKGRLHHIQQLNTTNINLME
jgi:hypothetical protein